MTCGDDKPKDYIQLTCGLFNFRGQFQYNLLLKIEYRPAVLTTSEGDGMGRPIDMLLEG